MNFTMIPRPGKYGDKFPRGVEISYGMWDRADERELLHILLFFKQFYLWNDEDIQNEHVRAADETYPRVIFFSYLTNNNKNLWALRNVLKFFYKEQIHSGRVGITFLETDRKLFEQYMIRLRKEQSEEISEIIKIFEEVEALFFPNEKQQH